MLDASMDHSLIWQLFDVAWFHMSVILTCIISDSVYLEAALSASEPSGQPLPPPLDLIMTFKHCGHDLQQAYGHTA
jgi:hypothetical protein